MMRTPFRVLTVAALVWLITISHAIWWQGERDYAKPADCVIVLGAAAYGDQPSPVYEQRIRHAVRLYQSGLVAKIIFTGGYGDGAAHAESTVGAEYAKRAEVPAHAILTETLSRTTHQNLVQAKALMARASLRSAIIVSDPLHLKRAATMAQDLEMTAVTSPTPTSRFVGWRSQLGFFMRELYFYHHYLITGA